LPAAVPCVARYALPGLPKKRESSEKDTGYLTEESLGGLWTRGGKGSTLTHLFLGVARQHEITVEYALGVKPTNLTLTGAGVAELMTKVLQDTGPDLTREKFLDTAESLCGWMSSSALVPSNVSPTDHRPVEAEVYVRATVDRSTDPPTFRWQPFGEPFGFESTPECP